jgi:hypothetical protein
LGDPAENRVNGVEQVVVTSLQQAKHTIGTYIYKHDSVRQSGSKPGRQAAGRQAGRQAAYPGRQAARVRTCVAVGQRQARTIDT